MSADESANDSVLSLLTVRLSPKPRASVVRRYEAMVRELQYLREKRDENLVFIRKRKWSDVRLRALFAVNSVYQEVLGPLQAAAKGSTGGLGRDLPILHGSQRFDGAQSARVNATLEGFFLMISEMGFQRDWMSKNTCGDLIFYIARHERLDSPPDQAG
jgi:hypothetical protein